ncbi:uncharacterized protein LOC122553514 isoform X2 [Chiloscyllium plagiosum]|uniref:uncharacterized protein LOC122553514 isoform X2 n=1 Tax=Chiloscyllium plagiosum TaxID=36176 RepID=UPI001CB80A69|nr:uncharacterized protein LOC122553514 isoform X2 [Chiloscyllium plagiosum]
MSGSRRKRRLRVSIQEAASTSVSRTPDYMEVLTTQYNALMNLSLPDSVKNHATVNQCLDPYDGDLESTSSESDRSQSFLLDTCTEKINDQSYAIVANDRKKLQIRHYKQSLQAIFKPECSYKELKYVHMEPAFTKVIVQTSSESEIPSNRVCDLELPTRHVSKTKLKPFGSLDFGMLTESPPENNSVGGEHGFMSMPNLQSSGKDYLGHQDVHLSSGRILKTSHERFREGAFTPKRKHGNSLLDTSNDRINKKKSRVIKN